MHTSMITKAKKPWADQQPPVISKPRESTLHLPALSVAYQISGATAAGLLTAPTGDAASDPVTAQPLPQGLAVVAFVSHQFLGPGLGG